MAHIAKTIRRELANLRFEHENALTEPKFSPPYMIAGLYGRERRIAIEASNRETIRAMFEQRKKEKERLEWNRRAYQNHLNGIHTYGFCPWCPANIFYD